MLDRILIGHACDHVPEGIPRQGLVEHQPSTRITEGANYTGPIIRARRFQRVFLPYRPTCQSKDERGERRLVQGSRGFNLRVTLSNALGQTLGPCVPRL